MKTFGMLAVVVALALLGAGAARAESATGEVGPGAAHEPAAQAEAAAEHEGAAPHEGEGHAGGALDIGAVMLHHVVDGDVVEFPGYCRSTDEDGHDERAGAPRAWAWDCRVNLREVSGSTFKFGALDLTPTRHVVMMWLSALLLLVVVLLATRRRSLVPRGLYNFVETLVAFIRNEIAIPNVGKAHADRFVPYLVTAFFFILFMNLMGLVPWSATATANLSVTVMMALFTFFLTQIAAIGSMGLGGFLAHLTGGVPKSLWPLWFIMVPVEVMGLFTKPFALTVRLFANMVAGHFVILALLGLIFVISPWVALGAVPMALGIFLLELFVALVQAYIFTMLSALFIGAGLETHGHGEQHAHAGPGMGSEHDHGSHASEGSHVPGEVPGHG